MNVARLCEACSIILSLLSLSLPPLSLASTLRICTSAIPIISDMWLNQTTSFLSLSLSLCLILFCSLLLHSSYPFACPSSLVLTTCFSCNLQLAAADNLWGIVYLGACLPPSLAMPFSPKLTLPQRPLIKYSISATTQCRRSAAAAACCQQKLLKAQGATTTTTTKSSRAHAGHALFNLPQQSLHVWPWQLWQSNQQKVKTNFEANIGGEIGTTRRYSVQVKVVKEG